MLGFWGIAGYNPRMVSSDASDELVQLRAELAIVREQADQARDKALVAEAEVAKVWAINADLL